MTIGYLAALSLVTLLSSPDCGNGVSSRPFSNAAVELAQYDRESAGERERDLEAPSNRQQELDLGDRRQRGLEQPNQGDVEDPDERQEDMEQGDRRQRDLEGRDY